MSNTAVAPVKERNPMVEYTAGGENIKLSYQIIRDYLTKGNGEVSDQDLMQFMSICKFNQLNPFLNEAYLIKFGTQPAQMIVSKEALMKRAEANENYDGLRAGLIVSRKGEVQEIEGGFYLASDEILGAWAEVYRRDRKFPFVAKVSLAEYDKRQSSWNEKKATMITKVAKVQALREAFPAQLGAMYTSEERGVVDTEVEVVSTSRKTIPTQVIVQNEPTETQTPKEINFNEI